MRKLKRWKVGLICMILLLLSVLSACGDKEYHYVVARLGEQNVYLEEAKFYAICQQAAYEAYYVEKGVDLDWSMDPSGDGTSIQQKVKDDVMSSIQMRLIFNKHADEFDAKLTDDELKKVDSDTKDFFNNSDKAVLEASGATKKLVKRLLKEKAIYDKICDQIISNIDDSEISATRLVKVTIATISKDSETPEVTAQDIENRVKSGESLKTVAEEYKLNVSEGNVGEGDMDGNDVEKLCLSLKTGEVGIVKTDKAYFVIYSESDNDVEAAQEKVKKDAIEEVYQKWMKTEKFVIVDKVWDKVTFDTPIYTLKNKPAQSVSIIQPES